MRDDDTTRWVRLRSGVPVVRRDDGHLQVGSHPEASVVVKATEPYVDLLDQLTHGLDPSVLGSGQAALVARLAAAGLVVDPGERDRRLLRRAATLVEIVGSRPWQDDLAARLADVGIRTGVEPDATDLAVVLTAGEPDRDLADRRLHSDQTTLFVAAIDGRVRLGPWVVPGQTACLQCLDAHARERDARHPVLVEQWNSAEHVAEVEPSLVSLALAWACADVVRWCHAQAPTTWSSTIWLDENGLPDIRSWTRHAWCGCGWALDVTG
ncbi:hypothetical protein [Nocardioides sp. InS609-2]|uniref:hypothetical protein n=1 Tax=Nocardioides sp. InS609-2 TaxID=2760705 RepID=UPI0020C0DED5|nr:hypothetical protein [Nocardioides sp. InS609-2]